MKKYIFALGIIFAGLVSFNPAFASEKIDNFEVDIIINKDSSINLRERIQYDFGEAHKHGIFREIPINYKARGGNYNLRISDIFVADGNGTPINFSSSYSGKNIQIKAGDADKYVTGKNIYVINYKIKRAINYFDDQDELYWNVTGNNWTIPIDKASARVSLYDNNEEGIKRTCYQGYYGSNEHCAIGSDGLFEASRSLNEQEGLTVVFGFPKGIVIKPSIFQVFLETFRDNWILSFPVIPFLIMFYFWWKRGRDPKGRGTIIVQYDAPDNIKPIEVGTVIDNSSDSKDISAEIISLAVRGYLKIKKTQEKKLFSEAKYELEKLKPEGDLQDAFDVRIMQSLFGGKTKVDLGDLKNNFYKKINEINEQVCDSAIKRGYYSSNPNSILHLCIGVGIGVGFIGSIIFGNIFGAFGVLSAIISMVIIIFFGIIMPARTQKGVLAKEYVLGLKEYLDVAEKDRIKFHNAPEKNPSHFEKLLPFAMVLGVEKEWADQFKDIYTQNPSWYSDPSGGNFNSIILVNNLHNFSSSANTVLASSPSSASGGGSGFSGGGSGGGFGGGGGGSW